MRRLLRHTKLDKSDKTSHQLPEKGDGTKVNNTGPALHQTFVSSFVADLQSEQRLTSDGNMMRNLPFLPGLKQTPRKCRPQDRITYEQLPQRKL